MRKVFFVFGLMVLLVCTAHADRNALPVTTINSHQAVEIDADAADLSLEAADTVNKNSIVCTGQELVVVWNSGATTHTVTFTGVADQYGRTGNITSYDAVSYTHLTLPTN